MLKHLACHPYWLAAVQYKAIIPLCAQGDLTDPLYFDFISFAQYSTVGTIIPKGLQVFKVRLALPCLVVAFALPPPLARPPPPPPSFAPPRPALPCPAQPWRPAGVSSCKLVHMSHPAIHHTHGFLYASTQQLTSYDLDKLCAVRLMYRHLFKNVCIKCCLIDAQ